MLYIAEFESRIRKWKQFRLGSWNHHVFTSHRSTSIEPRNRLSARLNSASAFDNSPKSTPLPRRFLTNGKAQLRPIVDFSTAVNAQHNSSPDDEDVAKRVEKIKRQSGILRINGVVYHGSKADIERIGELGCGTCGIVYKARFNKTGTLMAVKQMSVTSILEERKRVLMDLEVVLLPHDCPNIIRCYGCFLNDYEVHICMELMLTCLDKLYKRIRHGFPEDVLGKVALSVLRALNYLKVHQSIVHRDVKPSNMLLDANGTIKLCDFGIAGSLVNSLAKTRVAGCSAYMAPERLEDAHDYDARVDVWSLGISLVELARGKFPYEGCKSEFELLSRILSDNPPLVDESEGFSTEFCTFLSRCLIKDYKCRPKYIDLLVDQWISKYKNNDVDVAGWLKEVIDN
uniref:mitogen-activated protein kinase kinase n=1 Tax=Syphacia muris TaxID=451379 RepID=A0A0N5AN70_9BILA